MLTQTARFWFDHTADLCPNHVLDYPDPNVLVCTRLDILPVEIVVRDHLAGTTATSIWSMYRQGRREMYGLRFPEGLRENERLPEPVITPTTKARDGEHDEPIAPAEIVGQGLMSAAQWEEVSATALALFARGREIAARRGLILVDTKYEFGLDRAGRIVLADEIHTPDSSRYWFAESYPRRFAAGEPPDSFDKDVLRRWVAARCDPYRDTMPPIPREVIAADRRGVYRRLRDDHRRIVRRRRSGYPAALTHPRQSAPLFLIAGYRSAARAERRLKRDPTVEFTAIVRYRRKVRSRASLHPLNKEPARANADHHQRPRSLGTPE